MLPRVAPPPRSPDDHLVRGIGVATLAANAVNLTVGAGIFVLPGTVAALMGPAALMAYGVCAVAIGLVLLCLAECGTRVTRSGGPAAYVGAAFGPFAEFVIGMLLWAAWGLASDAAVAAALANLAATVAPFAGSTGGRALLLTTVFVVLAWLNILGVQTGARFSAAMTVLKLAPLAFVIIGGLPFIRAEHLRGITQTTASQLGATSLVLFFAFCGSETALIPGGEIKHGARSVPKAIFAALCAILTVYCGLQFVAQGVLGDALPRAAGAPLAAVADRIAGPPGRTLLLVGAALSMFGLLAGDLLANPRAIFGLASDRLLPSPLLRVHRRFHTPWVAIVTYAGLALLLALSSAFEQLARAASAAILVIYAAVAAATIQLRRANVQSDDAPFVVPGGHAVPLLTLIVVGWLLMYTQRAEAVGLAIVIAVFAAGYAITTAVRRRA
jgi:amino acid transporter